MPVKTTPTDQTRANPWIGVLIACAVILGGGAGYRLLASQYARAAKSVPIPKGTLAKLPLEIASWTGIDEPLDPQVIKATDTDDHVNRIYRRFGSESVSVFIGYGVNLRDLAPHRPEVCYPGAGWTLEDSKHIEITAVDQTKLPVQVHRFYRGGLAAQRVTVLNYYLVDGAYCSDVSLLRSRASQGGAHAYAAQVQIVTSASVDQFASAMVQDFAGESAPLIHRLLLDAVTESVAKSGGGI